MVKKKQAQANLPKPEQEPAVAPEDVQVMPGTAQPTAATDSATTPPANPALLAQMAKILGEFEAEREAIIMHRWRAGTWANEIVDDHHGKRFGRGAFKALLDYLKVESGTLHQARQLAYGFSADEIELVCWLRLPNGRGLTLSHCLHLAEVKDETKREQLLKSTVAEGWTAAKLGAAVDRILKKTKSNRGRPLSAPGSMTDYVADFGKHTSTLLDRLDEPLAPEILSILTKKEDGAKSPKLRSGIAATVAMARKLIERLTAVTDNLADVSKPKEGEDSQA